MRQTIDLHLYNAEDLEDSHSSYLSELKRNKKGSLDEFISTSVKYAIKQARSIQLNEELRDIKIPAQKMELVMALRMPLINRSNRLERKGRAKHQKLWHFRMHYRKGQKVISRKQLV